MTFNFHRAKIFVPTFEMTTRGRIGSGAGMAFSGWRGAPPSAPFSTVFIKVHDAKVVELRLILRPRILTQVREGEANRRPRRSPRNRRYEAEHFEPIERMFRDDFSPEQIVGGLGLRACAS